MQRRDAAAHGSQPALLAPEDHDVHAGHDGHDSHNGDDSHDGANDAFGRDGHERGGDPRSSYASQQTAAGNDRNDAGETARPFTDEDRFPLSPAQVRQELLSIRGLLGS
jgi:hypothetical protein